MLVAKPLEHTFAMGTGTTARRRTRADSLTGEDSTLRLDGPVKRRRDSKGIESTSTTRVTRTTRNSLAGTRNTSSDGFQEADGNFEFLRKPKRHKGAAEERPKNEIRTNAAIVETNTRAASNKRTEVTSKESPLPRKTKSIQVETRHVASREGGRAGRERSKRVADEEGQAPTPLHERRRNSGRQTTTTVEIPMSETPVIERNQKMRDKAGGGRRNSFGRRGRRASSLLDSGVIADPHSEISHTDWYKHIGEDVEPRRMRQLLIWCGRKALKDMPDQKKSKSERIAQQAAHIIDEELVRTLVDSPDISNWFSRIVPDKPAVPKKPNPRNIDNTKRFEQNVDVLQRLKDEQRSWESILAMQSGRPTPESSEKQPCVTFPLLLEGSLPTDVATEISAMLEWPTPDQRSTLPQLIRAASMSIDMSADNLHRMSRFGSSADSYARESLKKTVRHLENKYREVQMEEKTEGLATDDILRALAGS